ncbi:MAG: type II toxin-antitoxin system VapC family toxin [Herpetosiphonaceae bacterium]|nr:type II toxin-antitoxin system VapC family toxin [Herpetosiphonaceae bacterium]
MTLYFADTSALAKRYVPEAGTAWVSTWIEPSNGNNILIAEITIIELVSMLTRRQREGNLTAQDVLRLRDEFLLHVQHEYTLVVLQSSIVLHASQLILRYPLRTLDALQLACASAGASVLGTMPIFVSADRNLLAAAAGEGFSTDDPNAHPL